MRKDGRAFDELRSISFDAGFVKQHPANVLVSFGNTRVLVSASVDEKVPPHRQQKGWLTAEYGMLPASTNERKSRPGFKQDGRSVEIQRLIGRSLRRAVDLNRLGPRTILIDCDVIEADGGTRTASITGGYVALVICLHRLKMTNLLVDQVAAVSLGIAADEVWTDLNYEEDCRVDTDFNLVGAKGQSIVELQATAEQKPMSKELIARATQQGLDAISLLFEKQIAALRQLEIHAS